MKRSESIVHSEGWALPIKHGSGWHGQAGKIHSRAVATTERVAQQKNPALLSPLLTSLFPLGVVGAELRATADPALLFAGEAPAQVAAVPKRIQEFAGGRLCARRALSEFGIVDYPLRINHDRRPHWPAPVIGSISHTAGLSGAVIARRSQFRAVGLDIETVADVTPEIWPFICSPEDRALLDSLSKPEQDRCAALIFSAKEAFYKCQYAVTQQWLEFDDVTLDICASDLDSGSFSLRARRSIALSQHATMPVFGRFTFHGNLIVTGIALGAR